MLRNLIHINKKNNELHILISYFALIEYVGFLNKPKTNPEFGLLSSGQI